MDLILHKHRIDRLNIHLATSEKVIYFLKITQLREELFEKKSLSLQEYQVPFLKHLYTKKQLRYIQKRLRIGKNLVKRFLMYRSILFSILKRRYLKVVKPRQKFLYFYFKNRNRFNIYIKKWQMYYRTKKKTKLFNRIPYENYLFYLNFLNNKSFIIRPFNFIFSLFFYNKYKIVKVKYFRLASLKFSYTAYKARKKIASKKLRFRKKRRMSYKRKKFFKRIRLKLKHKQKGLRRRLKLNISHFMRFMSFFMICRKKNKFQLDNHFKVNSLINFSYKKIYFNKLNNCYFFFNFKKTIKKILIKKLFFKSNIQSKLFKYLKINKLNLTFIPIKKKLINNNKLNKLLNINLIKNHNLLLKLKCNYNIKSSLLKKKLLYKSYEFFLKKLLFFIVKLIKLFIFVKNKLKKNKFNEKKIYIYKIIFNKIKEKIKQSYLNFYILYYLNNYNFYLLTNYFNKFKRFKYKKKISSYIKFFMFKNLYILKTRKKKHIKNKKRSSLLNFFRDILIDNILKPKLGKTKRQRIRRFYRLFKKFKKLRRKKRRRTLTYYSDYSNYYKFKNLFFFKNKKKLKLFNKKEEISNFYFKYNKTIYNKQFKQLIKNKKFLTII